MPSFAVALLALATVTAALVAVRRRVAHGASLAVCSLALAGAWVGWYLAKPLHT